MPGLELDAIESQYPGWTVARLDLQSAWLDSRLAKRYEVPFASPAPTAVLGWLTLLVTKDAYFKRGVNTSDEQMRELIRMVDEARDEIKQAADAQNGLFDLPLRSNTTESGISRGNPRGYSEQSPYVWKSIQRDTGVDEDDAGVGSYR